MAGMGGIKELVGVICMGPRGKNEVTEAGRLRQWAGLRPARS